MNSPPLADLGTLGLDLYAPYLMNRIMGRYNAALRAEMAALGLTTPQMRTLAVLAVNDGLLTRQVADFAVVEMSTLSRALDRLVAGGLVRRQSDPRDNRAIRLFLTDAGRGAYARLWPHMAATHARMFDGIPEQDRQALVQTLQQMLRNVLQPDF